MTNPHPNPNETPKSSLAHFSSWAICFSLVLATVGVSTSVTFAQEKIQETVVAPSARTEIVVENTDPKTNYTGQFATQNSVGSGGSVHLLRAQASVVPSFQWALSLPVDGMWEVLVSRAALAQFPQASVAQYRINHIEGSQMYYTDNNNTDQAWLSLGTYPFLRNGNHSLALELKEANTVNPLLVADAVRLVWRSPLLLRSAAGQLYYVQNGQRRNLTDKETLAALKLDNTPTRDVTDLALEQYPQGNPLPSVFSSWVRQSFAQEDLTQAPATIDQQLRPQWLGFVQNTDNQSFVPKGMKWSRVLALPEGGYTFDIKVKGRLRLRVDNQFLLDEWTTEQALSGQFIQYQVPFAGGNGLHTVDIEYLPVSNEPYLLFGNLPPNPPQPVLDSTQNSSTQNPAITLRWIDGGDPDQSGSVPQFFVSLVRKKDANGAATEWQTNSGWIAGTEWSIVLPDDGEYVWSVVSSDGETNSAASVAQTVVLDRGLPWAQMQLATTERISQTEITEQVPGSLAAQTIEGDRSGTEVVDQLQRIYTRVVSTTSKVFGDLPAVYLNWWFVDALSPAVSFDVQAKEVAKNTVTYSVTNTSQEVTRVEVQNVLSGSEVVSVPVVVTEVMPIAALEPITLEQPIDNPEWITIAAGLRTTETVFVGNPGSTYEFRVRAKDAAGNQQEWHEGYTVRAKLPFVPVRKVYLPVIRR